jgi:hypothetical protein
MHLYSLSGLLGDDAKQYVSFIVIGQISTFSFIHSFIFTAEGLYLCIYIIFLTNTHEKENTTKGTVGCTAQSIATGPGGT